MRAGGGSSCRPLAVVLDLARDKVYVSNIGSTAESILVYSRTANGDVSPVASYAGTSTFLERPLGLAISP